MNTPLQWQEERGGPRLHVPFHHPRPFCTSNAWIVPDEPMPNASIGGSWNHRIPTAEVHVELNPTASLRDSVSATGIPIGISC